MPSYWHTLNDCKSKPEDDEETKELKDFKHVSKPSYSHTVDVTEVVYDKDDTKVKLNYVMKSISTMLRC